MRKKLLLLALAIGLVVGLAGPADAKIGDCVTPTGSTAFGNLARLEFEGGVNDEFPVNNNRGLAADMLVYPAHVMAPGIGGTNWVYTTMYVFNSADPDPVGSSMNPGDYIEFGWWRERGNSGYEWPEIAVVKTDDGVQTKYVLGQYSNLTDGQAHRFKFYYNDDAGHNQWEFFVDNVQLSIGGSEGLAAWDTWTAGYSTVAQETTDSCNAADQEFINVWRYSDTNDAWFDIGNPVYGVELDDWGDQSNHASTSTPLADKLDVNCNAAHGCYFFAEF